MTTGDKYIRHTFTVLFDVPADLAADQAITKDVLNAAVSRITELIETDTRLQALLRQHGIDYGWDGGSWETIH